MHKLPQRLIIVLLRVVLFFLLPVSLVLTAFYYPYDTDGPIDASGRALANASAWSYYQDAYTEPDEAALAYETRYMEIARLAAESCRIHDVVAEFARRHGLGNKKVLEVGSGRGNLQDIVDDYTGLDLSPSVSELYHKPFVAASATDMPFADNSFGGVWTIWVLEHIAEPERALMEIRRVLKPGGVLLLSPTWNCTSWAALGYEARPYSDFGWAGKLVKSSIPIRRSSLFRAFYRVPIRLTRFVHYTLQGHETRLRYRALEPNYDTYWVPDSDAAVSIDNYETLKWFQVRGDECLNCAPELMTILGGDYSLELRIRTD